MENLINLEGEYNYDRSPAKTQQLPVRESNNDFVLWWFIIEVVCFGSSSVVWAEDSSNVNF